MSIPLLKKLVILCCNFGYTAVSSAPSNLPQTHPRAIFPSSSKYHPTASSLGHYRGLSAEGLEASPLYSIMCRWSKRAVWNVVEMSWGVRWGFRSMACGGYGVRPFYFNGALSRLSVSLFIDEVISQDRFVGSQRLSSSTSSTSRAARPSPLCR